MNRPDAERRNPASRPGAQHLLDAAPPAAGLVSPDCLGRRPGPAGPARPAQQGRQTGAGSARGGRPPAPLARWAPRTRRALQARPGLVPVPLPPARRRLAPGGRDAAGQDAALACSRERTARRHCPAPAPRYPVRRERRPPVPDETERWSAWAGRPAPSGRGRAHVCPGHPCPDHRGGARCHRDRRLGRGHRGVRLPARGGRRLAPATADRPIRPTAGPADPT